MAQRPSFISANGPNFSAVAPLSPYFTVELVKRGVSPPASTSFLFHLRFAGFSIGLPLVALVHGATECELRSRL